MFNTASDRSRAQYAAAVVLLAGGSLAFGQSWVEFQDQTATRINAPSSLVTNDNQEKDYAWGDLDQDGDIDLVIVRKQPFTSTGRFRNVLLMNEDGVLTDRTNEYATDSDVPGDQGFLTETNDRDVVLVDVDLDGWLDMVVAPTLGDFLPKHISHPRIYMNLGNDAQGNWQGFRYEDARFPSLIVPQNPNAAPRFCSIAFGDVTGNGYPDLIFGDYDSGEAGPQLFDFNNRLLINQGNGFFVDESTQRMTGEMLLSAFGAASAMFDMNNDGVLDVVKQTALNPPQHVAVIYNNPADEGDFNIYDEVYELAPYFISVGDLNNDNLMDIVVTDDGQDRFMINQGISGGVANFTTLPFSYSGSGGDQGFGGNSLIVDLDNDGDNDVIITDVDVDIPGCNRRTQIYENQGSFPNVILRETLTGGAIASIPTNMLTGTHDAAVFDINGDGWLDMVLGRCSGTQVWINQPPTGLAFEFSSTLPEIVTPGEQTLLNLEIIVIGGAITPGTEKLFYSVDEGPVEDVVMTPLGGNVYEVAIPAVDCGSEVRFAVGARNFGGGFFYDPGGFPGGQFYTAVSADDVNDELDDFESDSGWQVENQNVTAGAWERVDPVGTLLGGVPAQPEDAASGTFAWITGNGVPGGPAGADDLDGGPTILTSPAIDLDGTDATISYQRWFFCNDAGDPSQEDFLVTEISNDGGANWTQVDAVGGEFTDWEEHSFRVSDFVTPTADVRVRFVASDQPNNSLTEAGIDAFTVTTTVCNDTNCPGDANGDNIVNLSDLNLVLANFGNAGSNGDVDGDNLVDLGDLNLVLANFGNGC